MVDKNEVVVFMMPAFKQRYKKLHPNQKTSVNSAIEVIRINPQVGVQKKGDLEGVYV